MRDNGVIDLRSDTVTLPTAEMLEAIIEAKLGDDVYGEDPTVNRLEELAAQKMGKEAALLVTSGTQANLVSLMSNAKHGEMVLLEADSHIFWYEVGGVSSIAGLLPWPVKGIRGILSPEVIEGALRPKNIHYPEPALICIENTHNRAGGTITTPKQIEKIRTIADAHGLKLYMDGARIFNAAVAMNMDVRQFTKHVDNLMFCLSKGLSCPIGSIVVGTRQFVEKARSVRKMLGGGMRQAGIIAAPGLIALEKMIDRLAEDHGNARLLSQALSKINGISIDMGAVQTNIVIFEVGNLGFTANDFVSELKTRGILGSTMDKEKVRLVTHRGIEKEHVERTIEAIRDIENNRRMK